MTKTRTRKPRTATPAPNRPTDFITVLGGDYVATRAVNAIMRAKIAQSLDELKEVAAQDGEKNFLYRIADLPGVGQQTQDRIMAAVYPQET